MNLVACLLAGAVLGWIANTFMQAEHPRGLTNSILVGVTGALVGNWIAGPVGSAGPENQAGFTALGLLVAVGCAIALLAVVHVVRRVRAD